MKFGVLCRLRQFSQPFKCLPTAGPLSASVWSVLHRYRGEGILLIGMLNRVESKAFRFITSPPLPGYLQALKHHRNVAPFPNFYRYSHGFSFTELADCMTLLSAASLHNTFYSPLALFCPSH